LGWRSSDRDHDQGQVCLEHQSDSELLEVRTPLQPVADSVGLVLLGVFGLLDLFECFDHVVQRFHEKLG
jgi:hypothetical protein